MTAIVDKKALRTLLSLKAIARSRCQVQTAPRFDELPPEAAAERGRVGAFHNASRNSGVRSTLCQLLEYGPQLRDRFGCSAASEDNDSMRNRLPVAPLIL